MSTPVKFRAEVMWAYLNTLNPQANKYTVDLCNLNERTVEALEGMGISVLTNSKKPEKGHYITCKSTVPMKVFDASGNDLNNVAIGNGSTATAVVGAYSWTFKNKKGKSPSLIKLIITDLKTYDDGGDTVEIDGDGFNDSLDDIL